MNVIVADANIFVYLFRCNLLDKILSSTLQIKITQAVFEELTDIQKRIPREHPNLRAIILNSIHNTSNTDNLQLLDIGIIEDLFACSIYFALNEASELDLGEVESIPLAIELQATFVSNDEEAVVVANDLKQGLGMLFLNFCEIINKDDIISIDDLISVRTLLENY